MQTEGTEPAVPPAAPAPMSDSDRAERVAVGVSETCCNTLMFRIAVNTYPCSLMEAVSVLS